MHDPHNNQTLFLYFFSAEVNALLANSKVESIASNPMSEVSVVSQFFLGNQRIQGEIRLCQRLSNAVWCRAVQTNDALLLVRSLRGTEMLANHGKFLDP